MLDSYLREKKNEIISKIAQGNLPDAIVLLLDFASTDCEEFLLEAVSLSRSMKDIEKENNLDTINFESKQVYLNKITRRIIELTDKMLSHKSKINIVSPTNGNILGHKDILINLVDEIRNSPKSSNKCVIFKNIEKTFLDFHLQLNMLKINNNEIVGIVGKNGSGKTTLVRLISGDLIPDKGYSEYYLQSQSEPISSSSFNWALFKSNIAYIPQKLPIINGNLLNALKYEASLHGIKGEKLKNQTEYIIERFNLSRYINKSWNQLSTGYQLLYYLAKTIIWRPKLLVLDEPLSNLDAEYELKLLNDLRNFSSSSVQPMSIVLSSHHIHSVEKICDKILFIDSGSVLSKEDLKSAENIRVFEISSTKPYQEFILVIKRFSSGAIVDFDGFNYYVKIKSDKPFHLRDLLNFLIDNSIDISSIKEISNSLKNKFI